MSAFLLIALLLAVSFLFSGIEAGLLSVNPARLRARQNKGDKAALVLGRLLKRPEELLATALIVVNFSAITALVIATRKLVAIFGTNGYWIALVIAVPVAAFFLEVLPKSLFRRFPYRALAFFAQWLRTVKWILTPVLACLRMLGAFAQRQGGSGIFVAREEVKSFTAEGERAGTLSDAEVRLIHGVIDFRAVTLEQVMVPMAEVVAVQRDATPEEAITLGIERDLDRLPVLNGDGTVAGLVITLDLLFDRKPGTTVENYLRRVVKVTREEAPYKLMQRLRAARVSLAVVVDGEVRPLGIVSAESVMHRLTEAAMEKRAESTRNVAGPEESATESTTRA